MQTPNPRPTTSPPKGRALHLVDLDNLVGGPDHPELAVPALRVYLAVADFEVGDHLVLGADSSLAHKTCFDLPRGARLLIGYGKDGADDRLIAAAEPSFVAARYDRVVICSGDHRFAPLARDLSARGVVVDVAARRRSLARVLREAAHAYLPLPAWEVAA